MNDLRGILRAAVKRIDKGDINTAFRDVEFVRTALNERGLDVNCHVGQSEEFLSEGEHTLEWYAGQLLDIVDRKAWFAMNSYINALDQYYPDLDE